MTSLLLRAKHWQLFLFIVGLPIVLQIILMPIMIGNIAETAMNNQAPDPGMFSNLFSLILLIVLIPTATIMAWFWSVVTGLQKHIPEAAKMKLLRFKIFFFYPVIYIASIFFMITSMMDSAFSTEPTNPVEEAQQAFRFFQYFGIIMLLHFFAMFCMFHTLYYAAKTYKTAELQRQVSISDFIGEFFMIWFFPIGIWFIQPKINQLEKGIYGSNSSV